MFKSLLKKFQLAKHYYLTVLISVTFTLTLLMTVFSILNTTLLKPLPYSHSSELFWLEGTLQYQGQETIGTNSQGLLHVKDNASLLKSMGIYFTWSSYKLTDHADKPDVPVIMSSTNLFDLLGVKPVEGRLFNHNEKLGKKQPSAIISQDMWKTHFKKDENIIGKKLHLNKRSFNIIGVVPDDIVLPNLNIASEAVWLPLDMDELINPATFGGFSSDIKGLFRVDNTAELESVKSEIQRLLIEAGTIYTPDIAKQYPISAKVTPILQAIQGDSRKLIYGISIGSLLLALIAITNLASMQTARAVKKSYVMAVSQAFGASKKQLYIELFKQNMSLIVIASSLSLLFTWLNFDIVKSLGDESIPRLSALSIDANLIAFTCIATLLITGLLTWVESLSLNESNFIENLKNSGKGTGKQIRKSTTQLLIGLQTGFSFIILFGSAQVLHITLQEVLKPTHVEADKLATLHLNFADINQREQRINVLNTIVTQLESLNAIEAVSQSSESRVPVNLNIDRVENERGEAIDSARQIFVDEDSLLFYKMQIEGKPFSDEQVNLEYAPVIINKRLAEKLGTSALGQKITLVDGVPREVIGISENTEFPGASHLATSEVFIPYLYQGQRNYTLLIKYSSSRSALSIAELYQKVLNDYPDISVLKYSLVTKDFADLSRSLRIGAWMTAIVVVMSLVLVISGISGMVSYSVQMRRYNLGIRLSLGATNKNLLYSELSDFAVPVAASLLLSFSITFLIIGYSRTIPNLAFHINWLLLSNILIFISLLILFVSYLPINAVLKQNPIKALRNE